MGFPSCVLWFDYGCHLMLGLSGADVDGQRHDGLNKEIRSVPRNGFGCYYAITPNARPCSLRNGRHPELIANLESDISIQGMDGCKASVYGHAAGQGFEWKTVGVRRRHHHRSLPKCGVMTD